MGWVPQRVQNLVIRNYCEANGLEYQLSATEYSLDQCYLMLEQVVSELDAGDGVVCYSLSQMPESGLYRNRIYDRLLQKCCPIYFALEDLTVDSIVTRNFSEDIWIVNSLMEKTSPTQTVSERLGAWENESG